MLLPPDGSGVRTPLKQKPATTGNEITRRPKLKDKRNLKNSI
jgi:hypothetical protein